MFIKIISELAYGEAVQDFDEALRELTEAVTEHQKAGTLQVTLKLTPSGDQVSITDSFKLSAPTADRQQTIMFKQRDGSLSRRDPRQPELPFRAVETDATAPADDAERPSEEEAASGQ